MPPDDPRSDEELVDAVNAGEAAAFDALYYRYRDWVFRLAYRFTRHEQDALDVMQDAFAYLAGKFPGFRLTAKMTTLLYGVVRSAAITRRRRTRPEPLTDCVLDGLPDSRASSSDSDRDDLAVVLGRLPGPQREVLLMRSVDGMTLGEIAGALEIPLGTVKSRLHNALATLRADDRTRRHFER